MVRGIIFPTQDGSGLQGGGKLRADAGLKGGTVHRALDHPRSDQSLAGQPRDEGLCVPQPEGRLTGQPLSLRGPPAQAGEVRLHGGLIHENQTFGGPAHGGLTPLYPIGSCLPDAGFTAFIGNKALFLNEYPNRSSA